MTEFISKRTIQEVLDFETGELIETKDFFNLPEEILINARRIQQEAISNFRSPKYVCPTCGQKLKISGKGTQRGQVSFFAHMYDSEECPIKTDGNYTKEEIEILKYARIKESERHIKLKGKLYNALTDEKSRELGFQNVVMEKHFKSENPVLSWKRPDVYSEFREKKIVFELQLSTTFLSVIVARDIFYKLNDTYIIWVFNFSANTEFVTLGNLMCKDIYYANKRNAFVFDEEAMERSIKEKELVLACIWFEPILEDGKLKFGQGVKHLEYVKVSELKFDEIEMKPYHFDADKLFLEHDSEQLSRRLEVANEKKDWIDRITGDFLIKLRQKELEREEKLRIKEEEIRIYEEKLSEIKLGILSGKYSVEIFEKKSKWGLKSQGEVIVEAIYSILEPFDDSGFAKVKRNRQYGFIDKAGTEVISCEYTEVRNIIKSRCIVRQQQDWFLINTRDEILSDYFESILEYNEKLLLIQEVEKFKRYGGVSSINCRYYVTDVFEKKGFISMDGEILLKPLFHEIIDVQSDEWIGIVRKVKYEWDRRRRCDIPIIEERKYILKYVELLDGPVIYSYLRIIGHDNRFYGFKNELCAIVDGNYNEITQFVYNDIGVFSNNIAKAKRLGKYGYLNINGVEVIPFLYKVFNVFVDNRARVQRDGFWGEIDYRGEEIIVCVYDQIGEFYEGKAIAKKNGLFGMLNEMGEQIIPFIYELIESLIDNRARIKRNGLWGLIDSLGNEVIPIIYEHIDPFKNNRSKVIKKSLIGYINSEGKEIIPIVYEVFEDYIDHKAKVRKDGFWGILDHEGEEVIPCIYDDIGSFKNNLAKVTKSNLKGYIDSEGKEIIPIIYEVFESFIDFNAKVKRDGLWGVIDTHGKEIIPIVYEAFEGFVNRKASVKRDGLCGLIRPNGDVIVPCNYDEVEYLCYFKDIIKIKRNGLWGIFKDGNEIITPKYQIIELIKNESLLKVKMNGRWGCVDLRGEQIVKIAYNFLGTFYHGRVRLRINGKNIVVSGVARYIFKNKKGYVDIEGNEYWTYWKDSLNYKGK